PPRPTGGRQALLDFSSESGNTTPPADNDTSHTEGRADVQDDRAGTPPAAPRDARPPAQKPDASVGRESLGKPTEDQPRSLEGAALAGAAECRREPDSGRGPGDRACGARGLFDFDVPSEGTRAAVPRGRNGLPPRSPVERVKRPRD